MGSVLEQCVEVIEGVRTLKDMYPRQLNGSQGNLVECEQPLWLKDGGRQILEETVHKLEVSVYTYVCRIWLSVPSVPTCTVAYFCSL